MKISKERQLHQQRALQEHAMTANAACIEAAIAHEALAVLHVAECRLCAHGRTAECVDCKMQASCDAAREVLADG